MSRAKGVAALVIAMTLAAVGGWVAASQIESPAEAAARTEPPEPSPILVPTEMRELSTDVITRGTGRFGSPQPISIPASSLKGDSPQVLTGAPAPEDELDQGMVSLRVSGRPVFLFEGAIPSFRDVGPGMTGADIEQLESGLVAAGFDTGSIDGVFDSQTEQAVTELYQSAGFDPVTVTSSQLDGVGAESAAVIPGSQSTAGVHVPADELLFVSSLPVRVSELLISIGEVVDGPVGTVTDASIAIDSSVPVESASLISEGMAVLIDEPDLGIEATGIISHVAATPGTNDVDGFHVYFEVEVDEAPVNVVNSSVRITIPVESTGEQVLAVPISAVTLGPDGSSRVQRKVGESLEFVTVQPGLSASGFVEVAPVDRELNPGDLVVVGFE